VTTFVAVGNATQPFGRLLDAVSAIAPRLPQPVIVQHGSTPFRTPGCRARPFVGRDEFDRLIREASLVICHAGAGCVIEALRAGKTPVVMARRRIHGELVDDHQAEFARLLAGTGKAIVADEPVLLEACASAALERQAQRRSSAEPALVRIVAEVLDAIAAAGGSR